MLNKNNFKKKDRKMLNFSYISCINNYVIKL